MPKSMKTKLTKEDRKAIADEARRELCRVSYADYAKRANFGKLTVFRHLELIAEPLQRIADGEQLFVFIEMPPRHGKSMFVTETYPSYFLGKNPDKRVIVSSYSGGLAKKFGRLNRNKFAENAPDLFEQSLSKDNAAANNWGVAGKKGGMITAGIGGTITGEGADCFPAGTVIQTIDGPMDIEKIYSMENPPLILSYDHLSNTLVYKQVVATRRKMANEFMQIRTKRGRIIESTADHRYYVNQRGYEPASLLRPGDRLTSAKVPLEQNLHSVRRAEERPWSILPGVLSRSEEGGSVAHMRILPHGLSEEKIRVRQSATSQSESEGLLLLRNLQSFPSCGQEQQALSDMRGAQEEGQQVLQPSLSEIGSWEEIKANCLSAMSEGISTSEQSDDVLRERMRRQGSFDTHGRETKQPLQNGHELCQAVPLHASANPRAGQSLLFGMQRTGSTTDLRESGSRNQTIEPCNPSHRRGHDSQPSEELNHNVQDMSCHPSQVGEDAVSTVSKNRGDAKPVYDIQVDGTHNFFANEILVHNCLIIDDPIKNAKEANSATYRDTVWNEWESTLSTRLHDGGSVIIIMTRWHQDDLIGRMLEKSPRDWIRLRLPAIAEDEDDLLGREIGEALCPELGFDEEWAEVKKLEVGTRTYNALYQQNPAPAGGTVIKRHWVKFYKVLPALDERLTSWDMTFKGSEGSDRVSGQVWGRKGAEFFLIDDKTAVMDFTSSLQAVETYHAKHRTPSILIEDKANGPAIINSLQKKVPGIIPIQPIGDKVTRASAVAPFWEAGNVYLPDPSIAPWIDDYVEELTSFPYAKHDDMVDSMSQALNRFAMVQVPNIREF